jgi:hypothetical protein
MLVISILLVLPSCFCQRLADLWFVAYMSFFALILGFVCLAMNLARQTSEYGFDPDGELAYFSPDFGRLQEAMSNFNGGFFLHPFLALTLRDMRDPTVSRCMNAAWAANIICLVMMYSTGLVGHLFFSEVQEYEAVFDYLDDENAEVIIGNLSMYVISVCTTCYYCSFVSTLIISFFISNNEPNRVGRFIAALVLITACMFSTYAGDKFTEIFALSEDLFSSALVFVLPPIFYLMQFKLVKKSGAIVAILMIAIGVPYVVSLVHLNVTGLIEYWPEL